MANFYVEIQGMRGSVSRLGGAAATTVAASHQGAVRTRLYRGEDGRNMVRVTLGPWQSSSTPEILFYDGPCDGLGPYKTDLKKQR